MATTGYDETATLPVLDGGTKQLLIDGEWVPAASGETFETYNPSTGAVLAHLALGEREDVDRAVAAARRALTGPWGSFSPVERQKIILDFADAVEEHSRELIELDCQDMGFPISFGSITTGGFEPADILRYYAGWATKITGDTTMTSAPGSMLAYTLREPVGVVGAIIPWNSPRHAVGVMGPALAAGCTLVFKPSELGSLSPLRLGEIAQGVGLPDGVLNIVTGFGSGAGAAVAEHDDVDKISFTGSTATGQSLVRASAGNLKRLTLELGGKSPDIVFADADLDLAIPATAMGVFGNSGQMCTAGSRLFVHRSILDEFLARLVDFAESLKVGNSMDPATMIGPVVSTRQLDRVTSYITDGVADGGEVLTGGSRITEGDLASGYFVPPTVFTSVKDDMRLTREEIFGPVVTVLPFDDTDEVIRRANHTHYGLVSGVWTRDLSTAKRMASSLQAGVVWINTYNAFDTAMPFGGYKMSGIGSQHGPHALDEFLKTKAVWINA